MFYETSLTPINMPLSELCVHTLLASRAYQNPYAIAFTAPGRHPLTYERLKLHIDYIAKTLHALGWGRNSRIAIVLPNGVDTATAVLGVSAVAVSVPLNPNYSSHEFEFDLSDLKVQALIVQAGIASPVRDVALARNIPLIELSPTSEAGIFTLVGNQRACPASSGFAGPNDLALLLHTSGTTARPKIVPLTHVNICSSAYNSSWAFELTGKDRCLNVMPLFHVHGLISATLASLAAGASVICPPGFDMAMFFPWIAEFRPTWYTGSPAVHQAVLTQASANQEIIERYPLRFVRSSSSPLSPQVMNALEAVFKAPVIEYYGMSEAASQIASNPLPPQQHKPGSVGVAAGPEIALMDGAGNLLPMERTGEIVIRGANVIQGYEGNPDANARAFTDGWFRTGDEGSFDSDGYLFVTGRLKEMINRGGEKISPREVDETLLAHPAVREAITFGVPHPTLGEDVVAAVVLQNEATILESEIREFAFMRLADYKVPSQVLFVDVIPKGPTGKPQRMALAEKLKSELKARFVGPINEVETILGRIWSEVLCLNRVGRFDNFFGLGGDSLLATMVVSRIRESFQIELPLESVFRKSTLSDLATAIEEMLLAEIKASHAEIYQAGKESRGNTSE